MVRTLPCVLSSFIPHRFALSCTVSALLCFAIPACQKFHGVCIRLHGYIVQPFGNIYFRISPTTFSADFSRFVVTTAHETACETSRLRCGLFPLIYLPHLLLLPAAFGPHLFRLIYPYPSALYVISARQAKGLSTIFFRVDTLLFSFVLHRCLHTLVTFTL